MNPRIFAEWLRRQGHHVVQTESSYWFNAGPGVYQAFPYHWVIEPTKAELSRLFRQTRIIALRYSTPLDAAEGVLSYHTLREAGPYELQMLSPTAKRAARRGLDNAVVGPITFARLVEEGYDLEIDMLARQGRKVHLTREAWRQRCLPAANLEGFEAWGACVDGRLAASMMSFRMDDWMYMLYPQSHRSYLQLNVNNALSFFVTRELLSRPGVSGVHYGVHSLDAPDSVDEFKLRMGYTTRPLRQRVAFSPAAALFAGKLVHRGVSKLLSTKPGHPALSKAEGILRFYLQGCLPLEQQTVPLALRKQGYPSHEAVAA